MPTNTRRPPSKTSIAKYVKNVGKSLALATIDVTMDNAPAMRDFLQSNDEYIKRGFAYIKNPKVAADKADRQSIVSRVYQSVSTGLKNFKEDITTGNLYNNSKAQQAQMDMFTSGMGFDFDGDMSLGSDDDFNWKDEDDSSKNNSSSRSKSTFISDSFEKAIGAAASTQATAVAQGTDLVIGVNKASTKLVITNMDKLGINISAGLASIYSNISITNKSIQTHVENSNKFYEATNDLLREQVALMRELVDTQRQIYNPKQNNTSRSSPLESSMDAHGNIKMDGYIKNIKKNLTNNFGYLFGVDFDHLNDQNNMMNPLNMILTEIMHPSKMITTGLMQAILPKTFKNSIKSMDKALSSLFSQMVAAINKKKFDGGLLGVLASVFGIGVENKTSIKTSEYKKDAIPFDGITKQAIIETIPGYLARIEAALTGSNNPKFYDYNRGNWTNYDSISAEFNQTKKRMIANANFGIYNDTRGLVTNVTNAGKNNKARKNDAARLQMQIDRMIQIIYEDGGYFNLKEVNGIPAWQYYRFDNERAFREVTKSISKETYRGLASKNMRAKLDISNRISSYQTPHNAERNLFTGVVDKSTYGDSSSGKSAIKGTGLLSLSYDDKGRNVFYYLREILSRMGHGSAKSTNNSNVQNRSRSRSRKTRSNKSVASASSEDSDGDGDPDQDDGIIDDDTWEYVNKVNAEEEEKANRANKIIDGIYKKLSKTPVGKFFADAGKDIGKIISSPINYMTEMIDKADKALFKLIFGDNPDLKDEDGKPVDNLFDAMMSKMRKAFDNITDIVKKSFEDGLGKKIKDSLKKYAEPVWSEVKSTASKGFKRAKTAVGNTFGRAFNYARSTMPNVATKVANGDVVTADEVESIDDRDMIQDNDDFYDNIIESAYGRIVTKRGLTMISPGEIIIPATTDRRKQNKMLASERRDRSRIVKAFKSMGGKIGLNAKGTVDTEKLKESLYEIYNENKPKASKVAAGGILGAGAGLLAGINPLLGAVAGAGISILNNSQTLQKIVFGEDMEDGTHVGGIIPEKIQKYFKKAGGDAIDFGVAGGLLGLVTGMGPLAGAAVGAGIGLLKNSETVNDALFGEDGIIGPENKEKISKFMKKAAPNALTGAGIGILTGPFGLLGNAAIGAGLGLITSTNTFHDVMFGKEDDPDDKGIFGAFKEGMLNPAIEKMHEILDDMRDFAKKHIFSNLKKFFDPFKQMVKNAFTNIGDKISDHLNDMFERAVGIPAADWMREKLFKPLSKTIGAVVKLPINLGKAAVSAPMAAIGWLGNNIRQRQVEKGTAYDMSAEERLKWREEHKVRSGVGSFFRRDKMEEQDKVLANMDEDQLNELASLTKGQLQTRKELGKELGNARKKTRTDISKYFNNTKADNGKTLYEIVGVGKIKKLTELASEGDMAGFNKELKNLSKKLSPNQINELQKLVSSQITAVKSSMDAISNYDMDNDEKARKLEGLLGRKIKGRSDMRQIMMAAQAESKMRSKKEIEEYDPEAEAAAQEEADRNDTKDYRIAVQSKIDTIIDAVKIISESTQLMANPDAEPKMIEAPKTEVVSAKPNEIIDNAKVETNASEGINKVIDEYDNNPKKKSIKDRITDRFGKFKNLFKKEKYDEDSIEAKEAQEADEEKNAIQKEIAKNTGDTAKSSNNLFSRLFGKKDKDKEGKGIFSRITSGLGNILGFLGIKGSTIAKIGLGAVALGTGVSLFGHASEWFKTSVWPTIKTALFGTKDNSGDYSGGLMSGLANKYNDIMYGDGTPQNPGIINKVKTFLLGDGTDKNKGLVGKLLDGGKRILFGEKGDWNNPTGGIVGWFKNGGLYKAIGAALPSIIGGFGLAMTHVVTPLTALIIKHFPTMLTQLGAAILNGIKLAIFKNEIKRDQADNTVTVNTKEFGAIMSSTSNAIAANAKLPREVTSIFSSNTGSSAFTESSSSAPVDYSSITDPNYISKENTYDSEGNHLNKSSTEVLYKNAPGVAGWLGAKQYTNDMVYDENGEIAISTYGQRNTVDSTASKILDASGRSFLHGALGRKNIVARLAANKKIKGGKGIFGLGRRVFGTAVKGGGKIATGAHTLGSKLNEFALNSNDITSYADKIVRSSGLKGKDAKNLKNKIIDDINLKGEHGVYDALDNLPGSSEYDDLILKKADDLTNNIVNGRVKTPGKVETLVNGVKNKVTNSKPGKFVSKVKESFENSRFGALANRKSSINDFAASIADAQGLTGRKAEKFAKKVSKDIKWNGAKGIDNALDSIDVGKLTSEASDNLLDKAVKASDNIIKAPTISSKAKTKITEIAGKVKNSKPVTAIAGKLDDAAKAVTNSKAGAAVKNVVSKGGDILDKIKGKVTQFFKEIAENNTIIGFFKKACKKGTKTNVITEAIKKVGKNIAESAIGKATKKVVQKIASTVAKIIPFVNIAIYVADFIWGYDNADTLLGVAKGDSYKVGFGQKCVCGLVHLINNNLLLGLINTDVIIDIVVDVLFPIFGIDAKELNEARDRADNILDDWNKEHPEETYTNLEDYNNKDKWTTKAKKKLTEWGEGIKTGISKSLDKTKETAGKAWETVKSGATNLINKGKEGIEKVKNSKFGQAVSSTVNNVKESKFGQSVSNFFDKIIGKKSSNSNSNAIEKKIEDSVIRSTKSAKSGKISVFSKDYWQLRNVSTEDGTIEHNLAAASEYTSKILNAPEAMLGGETSKISNNIKKSLNKNNGKASDTIINKAKNGKLSVLSNDYWKSTIKDDANNPLSGTMKSIEYMKKMMQAPIIMMNQELDKISSGSGGFRKKLERAFKNIGAGREYLFGTGRYEKSKDKPSADAEHLYQSNSAIANIKYGNSTIGEAGCAPVAATNLINNMEHTNRNKGANLAEAARFAERGGYTVPEGGTDMRYFNSYLASKGIPSINTSSKQKALDAIKSGNQVILLGQDNYNTKAPYGTNPHFITATGVTPNGDIIVEDPDLPNRRVQYKPRKLMKSMISSVITGNNKSRGKHKFGRSIGGTTKARHGTKRALYGRGTELGAQAILNVARSQIGVKEHQPNVVKYNNAYWTQYNLGTRKDYNNSQDTFQWCCVFVWWVFNQAGAAALFCGGGKRAVCSECAKWYKERGKYDRNNPKPGDIIMLNWDDRNGTEQHAAIVESVDGDNIHTIEGNTGDCVDRKVQNIKNVVGFCHIDYPYEYDDSTVVDMRKYGDTTDYKNIAINGGPMTGDKYSAFVGGEPAKVELSSGMYDGSTSTSTVSSKGDTIFTKIGNLANSVFKAMYGKDAYNMVFGTSENTTSEDANIIGTESALKGNSISEKIWNYLRNYGYTAAGTAGVMGNFQAESGLKSNNLENTKEKAWNITDDEYTKQVNNKTINKNSFVNDKGGYGLAQWTWHTLKQGLYENTVEKGKSISDMGSQLKYFTSEMAKSYPKIDNLLRTTTDYNEASDTILRDFEKPKVLNYDDRRAFAKNWYEQYKTAGIDSSMNYDTEILDENGNIIEPTTTSIKGKIPKRNPKTDMIALGRGRSGKKRVGDARTITRSYKTDGRATSALNRNSIYADSIIGASMPTSHYNGSTTIHSSVDYATFLSTIVTILMQIADNTTLLNSILEILSNNFNLNINKNDITKAANSRAKAQEALNKAIQNSGGVANMSSIINNRDTQYVLQALQAIASE